MFKAATVLALLNPALSCPVVKGPTECVQRATREGHVAIYDNGNFEGEWLDISGHNIGQSDDAPADWNNKAKSIRVGKGVKATFCDHKDCANNSQNGNQFEIVGPEDKEDLTTWNNRITHIRVEPHIETGVTLYDGAGCTGNSAVFENGDYNYPDFIKKIRNDQTKGIKVPEGVTAILYQHSNYKGWNKEFRGPATICDLNTVPGAKANDASSIKVRAPVIDPEDVVNVDLTELNLSL